MAIYRIYEEGGMHVLGTVLNNAVVGERVFNVGRLKLTGPVNSLYFNLEDTITDVVILSQVIYSDFQKFDGSSWGTQETILTNLNEFFNKSPYTLGEAIDVDTSAVQDNYIIQYNVSNKTWEAVSLVSQLPSPPPIPVQSVNSKVGDVVLNLNDLSDLNITTPTSNQIISYNSVTEEWENVDLPVSSKWDSNGSSIYYNSGNVGVGTNTPSARFQINGFNDLANNYALRVGNSTSDNIFVVGNDGHIGINTVPSASYTFFLNDGAQSSNTLFVNSYNRIGWSGGAGQWIEGWSGRIAFHIGGNGGGQVGRFTAQGEVNSRFVVKNAIHLGAATSDNGDVRFTRLEAGKVAIGNNADDGSGTLIVGNVGIGTTAPTESLQIGTPATGSSQPDHHILLTGYDVAGIKWNMHGGWSKSKLTSDLDGGINFINEGAVRKKTSFNIGSNYGSLPENEGSVWIKNSGVGNALTFGRNGGYSIATVRVDSTGGGNSYFGGLTFNVRESPSVTHDVLTLEKSGKVGIGTPAPTEKLQVSGNILADFIYQGVKPNANFSSVGISTSNQMLAAGGINLYSQVTAGHNPFVGFKNAADRSKIEVWNGAAYMKFGGYGSDTSPNIDMDGLFNPSSGSLNKRWLYVHPQLTRGASYSGDAYGIYVEPIYYNDYGTGKFYSAYFGGGNVGIGTATPSQPLHVDGNAKINGRLLAGLGSNVFVGELAGQNISTGSNNTFVGYSAGEDATTASESVFIGNRSGLNGSGQVAVGYFSLENNNGQFNIGIGFNANRLSSGDKSVAVGWQASYVGSNAYTTAIGHFANNTGGQRGFYAGYEAGKFAIGTDSVIVGYQAAQNAGSGGYNTIVGSSAAMGVSGTSTFSNTVAVGYQALTALTTGTGNTAVGYQAGDSITESSYNTVVGYQAGQSQSTHSTSVTALGYQAGHTTTLGGIFIGKQAGYSVNNSGNIFVGDNAGQNVTSGSDNIGIGGAALRSNGNGAGSVALGSNAGRYTTAGGNTLLGHQSGNGVAGSTFSNTVAVGYQALTALTVGLRNTAVGYQAGLSVLAGVDNTFLGYGTDLVNGNNSYNTIVGSAPLVSSNGNRMTAVGYSARAGDSSTTIGAQAGSNNSGNSVAMGYQAGNGAGQWNTSIGNSAHTLSTGNYNTSIGGGANRFTSGNNNVAVGYNAAYGVQNVSTFPNTVAVGYEALTSLTTGTGNTAVGYQAGDGITSAGYNTLFGYGVDVGTSNSSTAMGYQASGAGSRVVAIGYQAQGGVITNGYENVGIGYQANYQGASEKNVSIGSYAGYSGNVRSVSVGHGAGYLGGDYSVFLGYQAGYNETGSNRLYIENSNSASPLIYGEFDNDLIRINGTLEITGGFGFNGQPTSAVQTGYNTSNVTTTRTFDANNVSLDSLSDVVATLIEDLKIKGIISA